MKNKLIILTPEQAEHLIYTIEDVRELYEEAQVRDPYDPEELQNVRFLHAVADSLGEILGKLLG